MKRATALWSLQVWVVGLAERLAQGLKYVGCEMRRLRLTGVLALFSCYTCIDLGGTAFFSGTWGFCDRYGL